MTFITQLGALVAEWLQFRWPSGKSVCIESCRLGFDFKSGQTNDFKGELKSKTVFSEMELKITLEFYTDCRNFQSFLINQKLNVKLVMMASWRSVRSALLHARSYANLTVFCNPLVFQ